MSSNYIQTAPKISGRRCSHSGMFSRTVQLDLSCVLEEVLTFKQYS